MKVTATPMLIDSAKISPISSPNSSTMNTDVPEYDMVSSAVPSNQLEFLLTMARSYSKKGLASMALTYYSRALRIVNKLAFNSQDERLLLSVILNEIGTIHLQRSDPYKALVAFDLCLDLRRQLLDWGDERIAEILRQHVRVYNSLGDSESAAAVLEELLAVLYCASNCREEILRETWMELGRHQERLGLHEEAKSSRDEANKL